MLPACFSFLVLFFSITTLVSCLVTPSFFVCFGFFFFSNQIHVCQHPLLLSGMGLLLYIPGIAVARSPAALDEADVQGRLRLTTAGTDLRSAVTMLIKHEHLHRF